MIRPHQSLFRFTADVAIAEGHYSPKNGVLPVPEGAGLGVTIDRAALSRLHERYRSRWGDGDRRGGRAVQRRFPTPVR